MFFGSVVIWFLCWAWSACSLHDRAHPIFFSCAWLTLSILPFCRLCRGLAVHHCLWGPSDKLFQHPKFIKKIGISITQRIQDVTSHLLGGIAVVRLAHWCWASTPCWLLAPSFDMNEPVYHQLTLKFLSTFKWVPCDDRWDKARAIFLMHDGQAYQLSYIEFALTLSLYTRYYTSTIEYHRLTSF